MLPAKLTGLAASLVLAFTALPAHAVVLEFSALLTGDQEVPPVATNAFGSASIFVDTDAETIDLALIVDGISLDDLADGLVAAPIGPVHFHNAPAGVNGPIVVPFAFGADYEDTAVGFDLSVNGLTYADAVLLSGSMLTFDEFVAGMIAGNFYINVHTDLFGGGEIRGQIAQIPAPGALLLFITGAAGLFAARRRKKA